MTSLELTQKLLRQGLPEEEVPRRIAFVADSSPRRWREWFRTPAFALPLSTAAGFAIVVATLAAAQVRLTAAEGRWEIAFGAAKTETVAVAGVPKPVPAASLTRDDAAVLIAEALRQSDERRRSETAALINAASASIEKRQYIALSALADQMRYFERQQNIFYKDSEGTRAALQTIAGRMPETGGERP